MKKQFKLLMSIVCVCSMVMVACNGKDNVDDPSQEPTPADTTATESNYVDENGCLMSEFAVSETAKVRFSMGNLQYNAVQDVWRFAENQYDAIGADNANIAPDYDGWIDLFGWGTSGYNYKYPYMTTKDSLAYGNGAADIAGTRYDWGVNNAISNGGNKKDMWRTLTNEEWKYLLDNNIYSQATVCGIYGLVMVPKEWNRPEGITLTAKTNNWETNTYYANDWKVLQQSGAVFLPAKGQRLGQKANSTASGFYWTSSARGEGYEGWALRVLFDGKSLTKGSPGASSRGNSVRLVQDVK